MQRIVSAVLILLIAVPVFAADAPKSEEQKTLYAVGLAVARQLAVFNLSPTELEFVKQGITDSFSGKKTVVELEAYNQKIQDLANGRRKAKGEKLAAVTKDFIEKTAREKGAVKSASGMIYLPLKEGSGAAPAATDTVKVNYRGTLVSGEEFDSSYKRGQPTEFPLNGVIKCWSEGLQMMKPGGKAKLVCPSDLAYGDRGAGSVVPPNATLVFEVELLEVKKK
jgi:FKBP-type peptidyl-prolyl cis-trans isomerase FkpA